MASSAGSGKGGAPAGNPDQDRALAVQQLVQSQVAAGENVEFDFAAKEQQWFLDRQYENQVAQAERFKLQRDKEMAQQKVLQQTRQQGMKIEQQRQVAKAKQAQAQKPPTPTEVVNNTMAGTETATFRPQNPTSTGPTDPSGAQAAKVLDMVTGGRGVQQAQPSPNSVQMGGQTFTAPPETTTRINSLGVRPVQTHGTVFNMPTFQGETVTQPNVLSAADVARLAAQQQDQTLERAIALGADSGAPLDRLIAASEAYYKNGDASQLMALGKEFPQISRQLAQQELKNREVTYDLIRNESRRAAAQANLTNAEAALWRLEKTGAVGSSNWRGALGLGSSGGSFSFGRRGPRLGGTDAGPYGKLQAKDVYNEKEGEFDPVAYDQHQLAELEESGRLAYKTATSSLPFMGGTEVPIGYVGMDEFAGAIATVKDPASTAKERKDAREFLQALPFVEVTPGRNGETIIAPRVGNDDLGAADIAKRTIALVDDYATSGKPPEDFMTGPGKGAAETPAAAGVTYTATPYAKGQAVRNFFTKGSVAKARPGAPDTAPTLEEQRRVVGGFARGLTGRPAAPVTPPAPPTPFDVSQPPGVTAVPPGGIPQRPAPEMTAPTAAAPGMGPRAMPTSPIGPAMQNLNPAQVALLRSMGLSPQAVAALPPGVVAAILANASGVQMPPQIRALVPRSFTPPMRPPGR